jgi:hypothetical protein
VPADGDFALTRYNSGGTLDETFGTHCGARADFFGRSSSAAASALAIDSKKIWSLRGKRPKVAIRLSLRWPASPA